MKKILPFLLSLLFIQISVGQDVDKALLMKTYHRLDSINPSSLQTKYLLNKGFFFGQYMEKMKALNPRENILFLSSWEWKSIFMGIKKSGVGDKKSSKNSESTLDSLSQSNSSVPIGIISVSGEWLENYEIDENINAVKKGYQPKKIYKKVPVIAAAPLHTEVFSTDVIFEISESLFLVEELDETKVSIDFSDGNGFVEIVMGEKVGVKYAGPGEKAIITKISDSKDEYLIYSKILVTEYDNTKPDIIFNLSSDQVVNPNGRVQTLSGGQAWLYNGCDRIFDKPVIIVEGFDPTNENDIGKIRDSYEDLVESILKAKGYDVIYLNFNNGGASIQNNADVLKQLLIDVKQKKTGNHSISVIGESMGGLVARYALRSMEIQNQMHGVDKFISFDSPHLGANVPVGFQKLLEDVDDVDIRQLFNIAQSWMDLGNAYLNSPAARQMLLRYKGANPHSDFTALQNEFNQMGFPSQNNIRNISIINASDLGIAQSPIGNFNPGDLLFNATSLHGFANVVIKNRTNNISSSTKVSSIWITVGAVPTTIKDRTYTFDAFNYDISAGGLQNSADIDFRPKWWQHALLIMFQLGYNVVTNYDRDDFSFVPLFSSTASTAPRSNQSHLNRTVSQLESNNWTPFDAIYSLSSNSTHVDVGDISTEWSNLLSVEFGPASIPCAEGIMAPPPSPRFNTTAWYMCPNDSRNFWITNPSAVSNLYTHRWDITGPNGFFQSVFSENLSLGYLTSGSYTITLIRTYSGGAYSNISTTYSRVLTVYPSTHSECSGGGGGPIQRILLSETSTAPASNDSDNVDYIDLSRIRFWPNPADHELHVQFELNESSDLIISLYPASSNRNDGMILTSGYRPSGNFKEEYDIGGIQPGLYILQIQAGKKIKRERLIVK